MAKRLRTVAGGLPSGRPSCLLWWPAAAKTRGPSASRGSNRLRWAQGAQALPTAPGYGRGATSSSAGKVTGGVPKRGWACVKDGTVAGDRSTVAGPPGAGRPRPGRSGFAAKGSRSAGTGPSGDARRVLDQPGRRAADRPRQAAASPRPGGEDRTARRGAALRRVDRVLCCPAERPPRLGEPHRPG